QPKIFISFFSKISPGAFFFFGVTPPKKTQPPPPPPRKNKPVFEIESVAPTGCLVIELNMRA
ncbi:MAG: hypothetical protein OXI77_02315, partial [Chloroflexota bacterium]|nr:hypothetical protein [Chloroflexota bacterium]